MSDLKITYYTIFQSKTTTFNIQQINLDHIVVNSKKGPMRIDFFELNNSLNEGSIWVI